MLHPVLCNDTIQPPAQCICQSFCPISECCSSMGHFQNTLLLILAPAVCHWWAFFHFFLCFPWRHLRRLQDESGTARSPFASWVCHKMSGEAKAAPWDSAAMGRDTEELWGHRGSLDKLKDMGTSVWGLERNFTQCQTRSQVFACAVTFKSFLLFLTATLQHHLDHYSAVPRINS